MRRYSPQAARAVLTTSFQDGADEGYGPSLAPVALEISKPQSLHPTDLAVCPPKPELGGGALRIDRIEGCLDGRQNLFHVVRIHPLHDLFDSRLILGKIENFLRARIPREHAVERIVLPRPELG